MVGVGVQAGNLILNLWGDIGATPTVPPPTIKGAGPGWSSRIRCGTLPITQMHGVRAAVQWIRSEQQTQPCGYSIQIWWVRVLWRCSSNLMYVICILYAVCAVRQLLWACLPFNDPTERKTLHVGLHCGESYHSLKFQFLPGYQLDKIWCVLLSSGPACGSRWLKSIYLFLYRSDGISVAILGSS